MARSIGQRTLRQTTLRQAGPGSPVPILWDRQRLQGANGIRERISARCLQQLPLGNLPTCVASGNVKIQKRKCIFKILVASLLLVVWPGAPSSVLAQHFKMSWSSQYEALPVSGDLPILQDRPTWSGVEMSKLTAGAEGTGRGSVSSEGCRARCT